MNRSIKLPLLAGAAVVLASGSLLAAAQSRDQYSDRQQSAPVSTMMVMQPANNTGAYRGPGSGFAALSAGECEAFGGKVVTADAKTCTATGKVCYTANKDGSIHSSCITE